MKMRIAIRANRTKIQAEFEEEFENLEVKKGKEFERGKNGV